MELADICINSHRFTFQEQKAPRPHVPNLGLGCAFDPRKKPAILIFAQARVIKGRNSRKMGFLFGSWTEQGWQKTRWSRLFGSAAVVWKEEQTESRNP